MTHLHHLVSAAEWSGVGDEYRPASLAAEGFIHFSTADQIPATSLRYYAEVADNSYRFSPLRFTPEDNHRFHGVNERLSIENLAGSVRFYAQFVRAADAGL